MPLPTGYESFDLSRSLAVEHVDELVTLANTIPLISYTAEDILAETKADRQLHGKWLHGMAVAQGTRLIGFVGAYEREAEGNEQYPENTLYISELAIAKPDRGLGIGKTMLELFIRKNNKLGLQVLDGDLNYSVQTNSAPWNSPVIGLYQSIGFRQRALKEYPNRTDAVLGRPAV